MLQAWYRRGRANALLKNYEDAVPDLKTAFNLQDSISEKQHIKKELDNVSSLFKNLITSNNMKRHHNIETIGATSMPLVNIINIINILLLFCHFFIFINKYMIYKYKD